MAQRRQKTTVYLDPEDVKALSRLARAQRKSSAELIRSAIKLFAQGAAPKRGLPAWVGIVRGGRSAPARDTEKILNQHFDEENRRRKARR